MSRSELEKNLSALGFTELESKIYLTLLDGGVMSAYQIAKKIEISRPSIYNALEHMVQKGMAELIPNATALYAAQRPEVLLGKLRADFSRSADAAEVMLAQFAPPAYGEQFVNLKGFGAIMQRAREMLSHADGEVYLNTDMSLEPFREELRGLNDRGTPAVVFSFYETGCGELCRLFTHGRPLEGHAPSRLMIAVNREIAMIAGPDREGEWQATVSGSGLFVKMISEHIHNDIYLLRLRDLYGRGIYDKIHIGTQYENNNRLPLTNERKDTL